MENICQNPACNNRTEMYSQKHKGYRKSCSPTCAGIIKQLNMKKTMKERYGVDNSMQLQQTKDKIKETCLEKYGTTNPSQSDEVKSKIKETFRNKYGGHPMLTGSIKDKVKNTCMENYGVENPSQSDIIKEKKKQTCLTKYGVANPFQADEINEKSKRTCLEKYGTEHYCQSSAWLDNYHIMLAEKYNGRGVVRKNIDELDNNTWLSAEIIKRTPNSIATELGVSTTTVYTRMKLLGVDPINLYSSTYEDEIYAFLKNNNIAVVRNDRKKLKGKELDFYLPAHNIAIEFNGSYWHSELHGKNKAYHLYKTEQCSELGIHLIHVWEHEYNANPDLIFSRLKSKIGISNNTIYARKTRIKILDSDIANEFLDKNHLQKSCAASVRIGLTYEDDLAAVMTFGKSRFNKNNQWELLRLCNIQDTNIPGGASKLFSHFIKQYGPNNIISYADKSFNTGNLYGMLGFEYINDSKPAYYYTKNYITFESRIAYQKHKLSNKLSVFNPELTEWENMQANGYDRYWDCGTSVWEWCK